MVCISDPGLNPLGLTGQLTRLTAYHCSCRSGAGTNRACAHVMGVVIGLMAPTMFKSVKKNSGRLTDISLPIDQQPSSTGTLHSMPAFIFVEYM